MAQIVDGVKHLRHTTARTLYDLIQTPSGCPQQPCYAVLDSQDLVRITRIGHRIKIMNYQALIVPRETAITLREIKRALLTYEKVIVLDPDDRDMLPSSLLMAAVLPRPFIPQVNMGPARPLGKTVDHDDFFQRTIDECREALHAGVMEISSTFTPKLKRGSFALGTPVDNDYPLNPGFVVGLYRQMASQQGLLKLALADGIASSTQNHERLHQVAMRGLADADGSLGPPLPLVTDPEIAEAIRGQATLVARSRIGVLVKIMGYCEVKKIVPLFGSPAYWALLGSITSNLQRQIENDPNRDPFFFHRSRLIEIANSEFLSDEKIDQLTISQVLRYRTKAWGGQAAAREELFESLRRLAGDLSPRSNFMEEAEQRIHAYRVHCAEVENERRDLRMNVLCDAGKAILGGAGTVVTMQGPFAGLLPLLLVGAGSWTLDALRSHSLWASMKNREEQTGHGIGFGLYNFYRPFERKSIFTPFG